MRDGARLPRISGSKYPVKRAGACTTSGRKFSSKKRRAPRVSLSLMPAAASQIVFHSAGVTVFSPPSVTIFTSGPAVSLGQERRNATSASPWRSSVQPGISLNEIGAMRTLLSAALPLVPAHADRRPAAASRAAPPARALQRMRTSASPLAFALGLDQQPVRIAGLGVASERPEI